MSASSANDLQVDTTSLAGDGLAVDANNKLKGLRNDLKNEVDEEVRAKLMLDIEGTKKRKEELAKLLGM